MAIVEMLLILLLGAFYATVLGLVIGTWLAQHMNDRATKRYEDVCDDIEKHLKGAARV